MLASARHGGASTPVRTRRRKQILVDQDLQIRFVIRLGLILCANLGLFLSLAVTAPAALAFLAGEPVIGALDAMMRWDVLVYGVVLPLAATFLCMFGQGLRETFRIAGPNNRFRQVMEGLHTLHIPRGVRIRRSDLLQDTAGAMDVALITLHDRIAELRALGLL